jgi:hypothetical protein
VSCTAASLIIAVLISLSEKVQFHHNDTKVRQLAKIIYIYIYISGIYAQFVRSFAGVKTFTFLQKWLPINCTTVNTYSSFSVESYNAYSCYEIPIAIPDSSDPQLSGRGMSCSL